MPISKGYAFEAIRHDRLRSEIGRGTIGEQVKMALMRLRQMKVENSGVHQFELVQKWQDYVSVLEDVPAFKSYELKVGTDILFTGKRGNEYYFLAMTSEIPAHLYYGVRTTALKAESSWREGNIRFEEW